MTTRSILRAATIVACSALAGAAWAGPQAGDRTFSLSGTGSSDDSFDATVLGASGELGWFVNDRLEAGVRQNLNILSFDEADDAWSGSTRAFADYHFGDGALRPYLGANIGGIYGEDVNDTLAAGPEAGMKYYVKESTFIEVQAEYQFLFDDTDEIDERFDDGAFIYTLGVGFNF